MKPASLSPAAKLLRRLIRIPSVNPDDNPGTTHTGEEALARHLQAHLRKMGARVDLDYVVPGRPNLKAVFPVRGGKPQLRILLMPHLDTVSVAGMTVPPFKAEMQNGRIYGRGATDTKGSMAAMLTALAAHLQSGGGSAIEWHFAATMGEESGCQGARHLAKEGTRYDLVIAGEPTGNKIVHAHKGCLWMEVVARGRARHVSVATHRDNAIHQVAPFLDLLHGGLDRWLESLRHPLLGTPSLFATTIGGGSKANISPENCRVVLDMRTVPGLTGKSVLARFKSLAAFRDHRLAVRILQEAPPLHTDPEHPLIRKALPATAGLTTAPWFCDASVFGQRGMAAIALGPGGIQQAHTKDEYIAISDLDRGARCYLDLMRRLESRRQAGPGPDLQD